MANEVETVVVEETATDETKKFTQAEMDAVVATRLQREADKAKSTVMTELGVEDLEKAKADLLAYNELKESQKTEQEKQAEALALKEQEYAELQAEKQQLTTKLAMLTKGVNNEALDDVAVLAERLVSDDVTIEQAIDQVLEKYPQFGVQTAEDKPSIVKDGNMSKQSESTRALYLKELGLRKEKE